MFKSIVKFINPHKRLACDIVLPRPRRNCTTFNSAFYNSRRIRGRFTSMQFCMRSNDRIKCYWLGLVWTKFKSRGNALEGGSSCTLEGNIFFSWAPSKNTIPSEDWRLTLTTERLLSSRYQDLRASRKTTSSEKSTRERCKPIPIMAATTAKKRSMRLDTRYMELQIS